SLDPAFDEWEVLILQDRWADADAIDRRLSQSPDTAWKCSANWNDAIIHAYRGRMSDAMRDYESTLKCVGTTNSRFAAQTHNRMPDMMIDRGQAAEAVTLARRAIDDVHGTGPDVIDSRMLEALALNRLGRDAEVRSIVDQFTRQTGALPSDGPKRQL